MQRPRLRARWAGVCFVLAAWCSGIEVAAQAGGSATIAPLLPNAATQGRTPLFNWANGLWDLGEGFLHPTAAG